MAQPGGFEPPTVRLEGGCSIQLSYGCVIVSGFEVILKIMHSPIIVNNELVIFSNIYGMKYIYGRNYSKSHQIE